MSHRCLPGQEARSFTNRHLHGNGAPPSTWRRRLPLQTPLRFYLLLHFSMNKLIESMLAEVSPEMRDDAHTLIMAVAEAIETDLLLPQKLRGELPPLRATDGESDPWPS